MSTTKKAAGLRKLYGVDGPRDHLPSWSSDRLREMSLEEKVGQLFMVAVTPSNGREELAKAERAVLDDKVGGIIWYQGTPSTQVDWINHCQLLSRTPLLMAQDLEWGLAMRLEESVALPKAATLGALSSDQEVFEVGMEIGRQSRLVGIQLVLAPVVDVATNSKNPIIGPRSFGCEAQLVAQKAAAFHRGLVESGAVGCAKHFPGHGDADSDSHLGLPTLQVDRETLAARELVPFKRMCEEGIDTIMVGHLLLPKLDPDHPASSSYAIITELLREQLGFGGVIITDALDMKGSRGSAVDLLLAGNDLLLMPPDLPGAINGVLAAVERGVISEERIDQSVARLLALKERLGLHRGLPTCAPLFIRDLHTEKVDHLKQRIYNEVVTLIDPAGALPSALLGSVGLLQIGEGEIGPFAERLGIAPGGVEEASCVIVAHFGDKPQSDLLQQLEQLKAKEKEVVLVHFGCPYMLDQIEGEWAVIVAYEEERGAQLAAAELILSSHTVQTGCIGEEEGGKVDPANPADSGKQLSCTAAQAEQAARCEERPRQACAHGDRSGEVGRLLAELAGEELTEGGPQEGVGDNVGEGASG